MWTKGDNRFAIEGFAISIHFSSAIPPLLEKKVRDRARSVAAGLGLEIERPIYDVEVDEDGEATSSETGRVFVSIRGIPEDRAAAGQFREMLSVDEDSITYRVTSFDGWEGCKARFLELVTDIVGLVRDVMELSKVRVEIRRRYFWEGVRGDWDFSSLLRSNSPYLAPFVYEAAEPWHSTGGKWLERTSPQRRLLQTNLQANHWKHHFSDSRRSGVTLMTAREDRFPSSGIEVAETAYDIIFSGLDALYEEVEAAEHEIVHAQFLADSRAAE